MSFSAYRQSVLLGFTQVSNYRSEIWFQFISKILGFFGLILLWTVINKSAPLGRPFSQILSYLFIANGTRDLVDTQYLRFSGKLIEAIKSGFISSTLLKPANPKLLIYSSHMGTRGMEIILAVASILIGVFLFPPQSIMVLGFYLISIAISLFQSYSQNVIIGSIAFWTTEAKGIRNVFNHFNRLFSGAMIPLDMFPVALIPFMKINPFAINAYTPTVILQGTEGGFGAVKALLIAFVWSIITYLIARAVWKSALKQYEAIGI